MPRPRRLELSAASIANLITIIRGQRVIIDADLANLYGVETKALNQAVKRNLARFPSDFMLRLTLPEARISRSQSVTLKRGQNIKHRPYAFTEQGVAMLSSVLRSERAISVNVAIIRAFVRMREALAAHKELAAKLAQFERRLDSQDETIVEILGAIRKLMAPPPVPPRRPIGFITQP